MSLQTDTDVVGAEYNEIAQHVGFYVDKLKLTQDENVVVYSRNRTVDLPLSGWMP